MPFMNPRIKSERKAHSSSAKGRNHSIGSNIIHLMTPLGSNDHVYSRDPPAETFHGLCGKLNVGINGSSSGGNQFIRICDSSPDEREGSPDEDEGDLEAYMKAIYLNRRNFFYSPYFKVSDPEATFTPSSSGNSNKDTGESKPEVTEKDVKELLTKVRSHYVFPEEKNVTDNHPWNSWTSAPACFPVRDASTNTEAVVEDFPVVNPASDEFYMLGGDGKPIRKTKNLSGGDGNLTKYKTISPRQSSSDKRSESPPGYSRFIGVFGYPHQTDASASKVCSYMQWPSTSSRRPYGAPIIRARIPLRLLSRKYQQRQK